jgi:long-chain acyl-CoA synthetase
MVSKKNRWINYSWLEYYDQIKKVASSLLNLGLKPGDKIGIVSSTRHEWSVCDFAIMGTRNVVVPIYPNITNEDFLHIVSETKMKLLFIENKSLFNQWLLIREKCPSVKTVVCFENIRDDDSPITSFPSFIESGESFAHENEKKFRDLCASTKMQDLASIIYTSGTTGQPRGVMITHEQIISEVVDTFTTFGITSHDISLSFLPYSHVLGRIENWGQMIIGFTMAYAESIDKIKKNLIEIKPTILVAVPRIFEKIHNTILLQNEINPLSKKVFNWAMDIGTKVSQLKENQQDIPLILALELQIARSLVLDKIKDAFGGNLRFSVSGGAPLSQDTARFFHSAGVLLLEGYGLTETTAAIFCNRPYDYELGTVGKPIGDVEFKLAEDGELLIKSKKVMTGYYLDPESTVSAFKEGWFATGDIAEVTSSGRLRITDRKKDLIKTANGKYIAPQRIEAMLKQLPFISNVLVHGDHRKYIVVLITLDKTYMMNFAKTNEIDVSSLADLKEHPLVVQFIRKAITQINSNLANHETIKKFAVLDDDFTVEGNELTPSLKVKRKFLEKKYAALIDSLY